MGKHIIMVLLLINNVACIYPQSISDFCVNLCSYDISVFIDSEQHSTLCLRPIAINRYKGDKMKQEAFNICRCHNNTFIETGPIRNVLRIGCWWIQSDTLFTVSINAFNSTENQSSIESDTTKFIIEKDALIMYSEPFEDDVMEELRRYPENSVTLSPIIYKRKRQIKEP